MEQLDGIVPVELENEPFVVLIETLVPGNSPRLEGVNIEHTRTLAQVDDELPPIVVHRPTMQVIDGMHRLHAARLRGRREIEVYFFDGDEAAAFVFAVKLNMTHGLPLTLSDRSAAAKRILGSHPQWSDRMIASVVGLSATTVGALRQHSTVHSEQLSTRIGRDGKARPITSADGRLLASGLMAERPDVSFREIARMAGISPATVKDVHDRLERGEDPVPPKQRNAARRTQLRTVEPRSAVGKPETGDPHKTLHKLRLDPALRFNEGGRALLLWLRAHAVDVNEWGSFLDQIPPHCSDLVADLARYCSESWNSFADALESRSQAIS